MVLFVLLVIALGVWGILALQNQIFESGCKRRRDYYHDYLKTDAWQRKRYVVLKKTIGAAFIAANGQRKSIIKNYAKYNIGKEPIEWLVSVCKDCHQSLHR
jgi:hypothetical protein